MYPPIPLRVFGQNDFRLRGKGGYPPISFRKIPGSLKNRKINQEAFYDFADQHFFCCKPFVKYFEIYFQSKCITMDGDQLGSSLTIICGPHQSTIEMYHD